MNFSKLFIITYTLGSGLYINMIGKLAYSDILILITSIFFISKKSTFKYNLLNITVLCLAAILIIQIFSDILNETLFIDYIRLYMSILVTIFTIIILSKIFSENEHSIALFLLFMSLRYLLLGNNYGEIDIESSDSNYFKVAYVPILNSFILLFSIVSKESYTKIVVLLYSVLCLYFDARSNGLCFFSAFIFLHFRHKFLFSLSLGKKILLLLSITLLLYLVYIIYLNFVLSGIITGANANDQINKMLNVYNPFELIYLGRTEIFVLWQAIVDSPIIGHGSWARDLTGKYEALYVLLKSNNNIEEASIASYGDLDIIRAHSLILGIWVYSGIFGFITVIYLIYKIYAKLFYIIINNLSNKAYLLVICGALNAWDALFSPPTILRSSFAFFVAIVISENIKYINKHRKNTIYFKK